MHDSSDHHLLARHITGACSPAERAEVERWLAARPDRAAELASLRKLARALESRSRMTDPETAWVRLSARLTAAAREGRDVEGRVIASSERRKALLVVRGERRDSWRTALIRFPAAAAAAFVLAVLGVTGGIAIGRIRQPHPASPRGAREFSTRPAQRANLQLDDGTQIVLGAATSLRIPDDYGEPTRDVYLDGEAYFVVRHDAARPFAVHAGHLTIRDIGTRFAVTAYGGATRRQVVVSEGKVNVAQVELQANDLALIDTSGQLAALRHGVKSAAAIGWTEGRLAFDSVPFSEVSASIGRWWDLDIQLADPALGRQLLTVTFGSQSSTEVLDALVLLTGTRYERTGRTVTFHAIPRS